MLKTLRKSLVVLKQPDFRIFAAAGLISGAGDALVPIAFAIETIRVEPRGWGMACVLIALWIGRFLSILIYNKIGFKFQSLFMMIYSSLVICFAQLGLLLWLYRFENTISAMCVSAFCYGLAIAFFKPAQFVSIPLVTSEATRSQANSLLSIIGDVYALVGPLLGASLVIGLGFKSVLIFDVVTFLVAIILLNFLYSSKTLADKDGPENSTRQEHGFHVDELKNLPLWTYLGMLSWLFCSLAIGLMGAAGPTLVMARHSASAWAVVATATATGSLLGSAVSLLGLARKLPWPGLQVLCGLSLGLELFVLTLPVPVWVVCLAGVAGSLCVTASAIRWDTIGQSGFTGKRLHGFASLDQFVNTAGIPAGMILFGLSGLLGGATYMTAAVAALAFLFTIPVLLTTRGGQTLP
ncbi:MAG: MFS transporter [Hyphomicrobiales bacterium]